MSFQQKRLEFQKFQRGLLRPTSYLFDHRGSSEVGDPSPGGDWTVGGSRLPPHLAGFQICRVTLTIFVVYRAIVYIGISKMLSPKRLSFDHTEAQCFYHSMVVSAIPCRRMLACTRSAVATDGERHAGIIHSRKHPSAISYVWSDRFSDKFQSGSGGIRTQDPWIPSPTLYR